MKEPAWIEHDGSAVCPVPAGHDVEVRFRAGHETRCTFPHSWGWSVSGPGTITHYRDWTAFAKEQEAMGKDDVGDAPVWAWKRADELRGPCETYHNAFARYIAAHEQPPVDWLRRVLDEAGNECGLHISEDYVAAIRVRIPNIDSLANAAGGGGK